ncbi:MAG: RdgB/HAM1 family non-canonical purine NTP pyrophosphatase [Erysipelotrichaceae bacterium]
MKQIVLATNNAHKKEEFQQILGPLGYEVKSLADIGFTKDIVEDGTSFVENAIIKVRAVSKVFKGLIISDDSGICIAHLNGAPGITSARYMGEDTSYKLKNRAIVQLLEDASDRSAYYECAIALLEADGEAMSFVGQMHGSIALKPQGEQGFGYDPIFVPENDTRTLAQLTGDEKNAISHRGKAIEALVAYLEG